MAVKINFHGGKNQFFSPVTRVNFHAGYTCTGNTLIWLAGIPGKTCLVGSPNILLRVLANQMRAVSAKYEYADANQAELRARRVLY